MHLDIIFFRNWPSSITTTGMLLSMSGDCSIWCVIYLYVAVHSSCHWQAHPFLFDRPSPPACDLTLFEDVMLSTANALHMELNQVLEVVQDIIWGKDFKLFLKVPGFWMVCFLHHEIFRPIVFEPSLDTCRWLYCCGLSQLWLQESISSLLCRLVRWHLVGYHQLCVA